MEDFFNTIPYTHFKEDIFIHNKKNRLSLNHLYLLLQNAYSVSNSINYKIERNINPLPSMPYKGSIYFPKHIHDTIQTQSEIYEKITLYFNERIISLHFIYMKDEYNPSLLHKYLPQLLLLFSLMNEMSSGLHINKTLTVHLYMTKEKKVFSENCDTISDLSATHINSALTYICMEHGMITIYREEEWFKSLIHECIHSFCLDFSSYDTRSFEEILMKSLPNTIRDPRYSETYTEIWAEIINIAFISFFMSKRDFNNFTSMVEFYMQVEIIHSVTKANQILAKNGITFETLIEKRDWVQQTHVYEYHILKTILLFSAGEFMSWCYENNGLHMIPIQKNNIDDLCKLVITSYKHPYFIYFVKKIGDKFKSNSLRMSICEF